MPYILADGIALEPWHLHDLLYLTQNALLATTGDKLALMGRDGTEGATTETTTVDVDRKLNHLVGRNNLILILGMRHSGVGQVKRSVEFFGRHRRIRWIDHRTVLAYRLYKPLGVHLI